MQKINIKNLSLDQLRAELATLGVEGYRYQQLIRWLYQMGVKGFDEMTNIKKSFRDELEARYAIKSLSIDTVAESEDGTRKFLIHLEDGRYVECVLIPSESRNTLCVSSQVGCAMDCQFCLTATMGLYRNLSVFEIVEQVTQVQGQLANGERISNIVFMGMGEPLANPQQVFAAIEILLDEMCFNFSRNHITVSTSGIVPQIEQFGDRTKVKLAISLNATTDAVRDVIMPINKKYNIERLLEACQKMTLPNRNRITFEYVMLHGVNDFIEDAERLVRLLSRVKAKINLIPFNEFPGSPFKRPPDQWILKFQKVLLDKGYVANIRRSRGRDILGACGQLATARQVA